MTTLLDELNLPTRTVTTFIGPIEAQLILDLNTDNYRPINKKHIDHLESEMSSGRWHGLTVMKLVRLHDTLMLADGQHRLLAIIKGGHYIEVLFILEDELQVVDVLDTGLTRSLATVLRRHGEKNCSPLSAGLRWGVAHQRNELPGIGKVSPTEALQFLEDHPGYRDSASLAGSMLHGNPLKVPAGPCVWLHYQTHEINQEWAEFFWDRLIDGTSMEKGNPILVLRERLIKNASDTSKLRDTQIAAFMIKAWNFYLEGEEIKLLRWYKSGPYKEPFPELHAPVS